MTDVITDTFQSAMPRLSHINFQVPSEGI